MTRGKKKHEQTCLYKSKSIWIFGTKNVDGRSRNCGGAGLFWYMGYTYNIVNILRDECSLLGLCCRRVAGSGGLRSPDLGSRNTRHVRLSNSRCTRRVGSLTCIVLHDVRSTRATNVVLITISFNKHFTLQRTHFSLSFQRLYTSLWESFWIPSTLTRRWIF